MANPKLCEIIAVTAGKKGEAEKAVTEAYHKFQKGELFDGISRTYRPRAEDGEALPAESKQPQLRASDLIAESCKAWAELWDLTMTLDSGNCEAKGELLVSEDQKPYSLLSSIPVTTFLFLAKQLENVQTFISKLPTPDPAEVWEYDANADMLKTAPRQTARTKKVQKPLVLYPATVEHPAQTQLITEDVIAGDWSQILFTTRITAKEKNAMMERVQRLRDAVQAARERANAQEVKKHHIGRILLNYVFGPLAGKEGPKK